MDICSPGGLFTRDFCQGRTFVHPLNYHPGHLFTHTIVTPDICSPGYLFLHVFQVIKCPGLVCSVFCRKYQNNIFAGFVSVSYTSQQILLNVSAEIEMMKRLMPSKMAGKLVTSNIASAHYQRKSIEQMTLWRNVNALIFVGHQTSFQAVCQYVNY